MSYNYIYHQYVEIHTKCQSPALTQQHRQLHTTLKSHLFNRQISIHQSTDDTKPVNNRFSTLSVVSDEA